MSMPQSRRRWTRWLIGAAGAVLLIGLLAPAGRRAVASVTLNYFRAQWQADLETVLITWETATELNTVGFIVQRSTSPGSGYVDITEVIPAVGDQLSGWTYDPVVDDPFELTIGVTYWYQLVVINTTPPNDTIPAIGVVAGNEASLTPSHTPTATATRTATTAPSGGNPTATFTPTPTPTPTATRTRTPTPTATLSPTPGPSPTSGRSPTPFNTSVAAQGATVTPIPLRTVTPTPTPTPIGPVTNRTATPDTRSAATALPIPEATAVSVAIVPATQLPPVKQPLQAGQPPAAVPPTLAPTNATFVAVAPIVVTGDSDTPTEATSEKANLSVVALLGAAAVLLLGGVYAILRQTGKS